jgi:hypothetical protein
MPDKTIGREAGGSRRDNYVIYGIVLAAVVAVLLLFGSNLFTDEKSVDVTPTQPSTESPAIGGTQNQ